MEKIACREDLRIWILKPVNFSIFAGVQLKNKKKFNHGGVHF